MLKQGKFKLYHPWYTRDAVSKIDAFFVFGDNVERKGTGPKSGQAVIRGLPNALGIAVKWRPSMEPGSFFDDYDRRCEQFISNGFHNVAMILRAGHDVFYPADGIGTGRAQLKLHAPGLYHYLTLIVDGYLEKYK